MPYVIRYTDNEGTIEKRKGLRPVHLEYMVANAHRVIASGGLFTDDGEGYNGGLIILDTDDRQEAVDFIENDPFFKNGIFSNYTVNRWKKAIFDYKRITI